MKPRILSWLGVALVLALAGCGARIDQEVTDPRARALKQLVEAIPPAHSGQKALVVLNPLGQGQPGVAALESATLASLDKALHGRMSIITDTPALQPGARENPAGFEIPPGSTAPLSFLMTEDAFTQLAAKHPKAALIISLVGYPAGGLQHRHPPAVLLYPDVRAFGDRKAMQQAFRDGSLIAFILPGHADTGQLYTQDNAASVPWDE